MSFIIWERGNSYCLIRLPYPVGNIYYFTNTLRFHKRVLLCIYFGRKHEDLFHPENSCSSRAKPEGDMNFMGGTNLYVS